MIPPNTVIEETERRYNNRKKERDSSKDKINAGNLISANDPERVTERMLRISRAQSTLAESNEAINQSQPSSVADTFALERVLGKSDLVSVNFLSLALRAARTVGRIRVQTAAGRINAYGTGFLVSPRLLITNHHVLADEMAAAPSLVEFNYQESLDNQVVTSTLFRFQPDVFFLTNEYLDYTLVAVQDTSLDGEVKLASFGWLALIEKQGKILKGEYMNIIQHPNGDLKRLAFRENLLVDLFDDFLHYETDTSPGSSGAPVLNDQWEVVALHHSGVPARNAQGQILSLNDEPWTGEMGEHLIKWIANEGIRTSRLVADINKQQLTDEKARLREELFLPLTSFSSPSAFMNRRVPNAEGASTNAADDSITWTLPLQVTVRLGQPITGSTIQPVVASSHSSLQRPNEHPKPKVSIDNEELAESLAELQEARTRIYYDEASDQRASKEYYGDLNADNPKALYQALSQLIQMTHSTRMPYKPGMHVYPWIDLHPDLKLRSIYSGKTFEPEEIIRRDFEVSKARAVGLREGMLTELVSSLEKIEIEISRLEDMLPYNCEHSIPQSWFEKRQPMKGDLHHLFTCESDCNSFRGNTPYFDFPDFEETIRSDCGKRQERSFEPSSGKGAVARATLYFLLRYPSEINDTPNEFIKDRISILLDWHMSDPVTRYEQHRNMAIFAKQGNRNPIIDHPEWAEKIDFSLGLGSS